jgi:hypothetical protein
VSELTIQYSSASDRLVGYIPNCTASGRVVSTSTAGSRRVGTGNFRPLLLDFLANVGTVLENVALTKVLHVLQIDY